MTLTPPRTLKELQDMPPGPNRIIAARAYIAEREHAIADALAIRNADIRELIGQKGLAETARITGLSLSTIKLVKGQA